VSWSEHDSGGIVSDVEEGDSIGLEHACCLVDMTEHMILRPSLRHNFPQVGRAAMLATSGLIEDAQWRAVRDQQIDLLRNAVPNDLLILLIILESVSHVVRAVGRPEYANTFDLHKLVLEVNTTFSQL
jgi:hypothetical protein